MEVTGIPERNADAGYAVAAAEMQQMEAVLTSLGWIKGSLQTPCGVCLMGAYVYRAGGPHPRMSVQGKLVAALLETAIRNRDFPMWPSLRGWDAVVSFNDWPATTYDDVLAVLHGGQELALTSP